MKLSARLPGCAILASAVTLFSAACSPADVSDPIAEQEPAASIEIVTRPGEQAGLIEGDTIRVSAHVVDRKGQPFTTGVVTWETAGIIMSSDARSALIMLSPGSIQIRASIDPGRGLNRLSDTLAVTVAPRLGKAFLWSRDAEVMEIPPPPGASTFTPVDINDAGQVLGTAVFRGSTSSRRAFIWSAAGGYIDLGNFPGASNDVEGMAINQSGSVSGYTHHGFAGPVRAFVWTAQSGITRPAFDQQSSSGSVATGINVHGAIAGALLGNLSSPFRWNPETGLAMLPLRSECGSVIAINDAGDVVGYEGVDLNGFGCSPRALLLWDNAGQRMEIEACTSVGSCSTEIRAMNDARVVTGRRNRSAFRWSPSTGFTSIGYEEADGYDINDAGDVVGGLWYGVSLPFMWTSGGKVIDIPLPPRTESGIAVAVNDKGQVVGTAR